MRDSLWRQIKKRAWWESNPRPFAPEANALSTEPQAHVNVNIHKSGLCSCLAQLIFVCYIKMQVLARAILMND